MSSKAAAAIAWRRRTEVIARLLAATGGGYVCTVTLASLAALLLHGLAGLPRGEAALLAILPGFLLFLAWILWSFAEPRPWRLWATLLGLVLAGSSLRHGLSAILLGEP